MVVLPDDKVIKEKISSQLLTTESTKLTIEICHPDVECKRSQMKPIVGTRFHKIGEDYDLCEAEFDKLPETEHGKNDKVDSSTPSPSDDEDLVVVDQPWTEELKILEGMGFTDKEQLKLLLNENKSADPERVLLATIAALLK